MPFRSTCVKCAKHAVLRWTIFNGNEAVVAPLCLEHGEPLAELVTIVGPKPASAPATGPIATTAIRAPKVSPIQGWTKPDDD